MLEKLSVFDPIAELKTKLKLAPTTEPYFREVVTDRNISGDLEFHLTFVYANQSNQEVLKKLKSAASSLGYRIKTPILELLPVPQDFLLSKGPVLIHKGFFIGDGINNLEQLSQTGIWGNIDRKYATYMKLPNSKIKPNSPSEVAWKFKLPVTLTLDTRKLLELRTVFSDPEPLVTSEPLGESFFVMGGIPATAIIDIE